MIAEWLSATGAVTVPLFDTFGLTVKVIERGGVKKLKRSPMFDGAVIKLVETGLEQQSWRGLLYVMHHGEDSFRPLYVGKAERRGVKQPTSFNLANIRTNQHAFAWWGYGLAYHIGDLSHAIFKEDNLYKKPDRKYEKWAQALFAQLDLPILCEPTFVTLLGWVDGMRGPSGLIGSVPAVEKELIALCSGQYGDSLLNVDGR